MIPDFKPILISTNPEFPEIEVYFAHDIHKGSEVHDAEKWDRLKKEILAQENRFVIFAGDFCDTAIIGSKSDIYTAQYSTEEQKLWFTQQLYDLRSRVLAIVPGNHDNRITKATGLYMAYDCALMAECADKYRQHFAFVDIGVGSGGHEKGKQTHYVGFVAHRLRDCKSYNGADFLEGIDFAAYGHDHDPKDHSRSKLVYDAKNKYVRQHDVEIINSGAFLTYGSYVAELGYRPQSAKIYKLILSGGKNHKKELRTVGFHV